MIKEKGKAVGIEELLKGFSKGKILRLTGIGRAVCWKLEREEAIFLTCDGERAIHEWTVQKRDLFNPNLDYISFQGKSIKCVSYRKDNPETREEYKERRAFIDKTLLK